MVKQNRNVTFREVTLTVGADTDQQAINMAIALLREIEVPVDFDIAPEVSPDD